MRSILAALTRDRTISDVDRLLRNAFKRFIDFECAVMSSLPLSYNSRISDYLRPIELILARSERAISWRALTHSGQEIAAGELPLMPAQQLDPRPLPYKTADARIGLALPSASAFRRSLPIPNLHGERLLAFARQELQLRTPISPDAVAMRLDVKSQPGFGASIVIEETLVRKDIILETASAIGLSPANVEFVDVGDGAECRRVEVNAWTSRFLPFAALSIRSLALALPVTALLAGTFSYCLGEQRIRELTALEGSVRTTALSVKADKTKLENEIKGDNALQSLLRRPRIIDLLRMTSVALPDDVFLVTWTYKDNSIALSGYANSTAALVSVINDTNQFIQATVASSIAPDGAAGKERFSLTAHVKDQMEVR